jgi:hypothetical protein
MVTLSSYSSALKIEAASLFRNVGKFYQTKQQHTPTDKSSPQTLLHQPHITQAAKKQGLIIFLLCLES